MSFSVSPDQWCITSFIHPLSLIARLSKLLTSHLLQAMSPSIVPATTHVINAALAWGMFLTTLEQARVTALTKEPSLHSSSSWEPPTLTLVSLLPFFPKVMEKTAFKQVTEFLSRHDLLDPNQSGHSTETALLSVTSSLWQGKQPHPRQPSRTLWYGHLGQSVWITRQSHCSHLLFPDGGTSY